MRIKENSYDDFEFYSKDMQKRVVEIFNYASQIKEINIVLDKIKIEASSLRELFYTEEEIKEKNQVLKFFDERMRATVYYTLRNMEGYQEYRWKELIYEGEKRE